MRKEFIWSWWWGHWRRWYWSLSVFDDRPTLYVSLGPLSLQWQEEARDVR